MVLFSHLHLRAGELGRSTTLDGTEIFQQLLDGRHLSLLTLGTPDFKSSAIINE